MPSTTTASRKWNEAHLERIYLTVHKGDKDGIQAAAQAAGQSVNGYILEAIRARMERDATVTDPDK